MKRNIIIIGPAFPFRGGIANFNNSLAVSFKQNGYNVKVFSFSLQYPSILFPGKTQYETGDPPKDIDILPVINSINPFNWFKVSKMIKKENPDYVIIRYWLPFMSPCLGTIARLVKKNIKILAITDNVIPHEKRIGDYFLTKYFVKSCDAFLTLSSSVLDDLDKFINTDNKVFIPHPIYDSFGPIVEKNEAKKAIDLDKECNYILFFGFVRKYKGLDIMFKVMSDERIKNLGIKLIVAGEFYENKQIYLDMIDEYDIKDNIVLRDEFIKEEDVKNYFCAADLITQTYRTATQSGVTQIGYHFERPMLVTDVGGLAEIVPHNKVGYVCDINIKEIADSIIDFYENDKEDLFHKNTIKEKKRFDWHSFVKKADQLIVNCVK